MLTALNLHVNKIIKSILYHVYFYRIIKKQYKGLHVGSGSNLIKGFCNMDCNLLSACDIIADIEKLKFYNNSIEVFYSSHVFEHVVRSKSKATLKEWYRVLKPNGKLYICVPDIETLIKIYLNNICKYDTKDGRYSADLACGIIFGGQSNKFDFHHYGYSFVTLKKLLEDIGFKNIKRFSHSNLSFHNIIDAGNSAVINDIPVSLNIECTK